MNSTATALLATVRARSGRLVDDVAALVECESPSSDLDALRSCAGLVAELGRDLIGLEPEEIVVDGRTHLCFRGGGPTAVLLLGHYDTVWPLGTLARWPFSVAAARATGPGIFDMKAGLVQFFHAIAALEEPTGVTFLVTADEEIGSPSSRALIEREAALARAVLVAEASADGALKVGRKGVSLYDVHITGRAAHAGLDPAAGVNATVEAARQVLAIDALVSPASDTTVTPTVLSSGRTANTVPAAAVLTVDVRAMDAGEQSRIDDAMRALRPVLPGAQLRVDGGVNRPPLEPRFAAGLFRLASELGRNMGLPALRGVTVGGGSDGNFTAGIGIPTLDGLGAVGDHAHAEGEWASVEAMPDRAALSAALIDAIRHGAAVAVDSGREGDGSSPSPTA